MAEALMLVAGVCSDMFFTAFAYGKNGIRIPLVSSFLISFTGAGILAFALAFSDRIAGRIPSEYCTYGGCAILFSIGCIYLLKDFIKERLKSHRTDNKQIEIIIDNCRADCDNSKVLSAGEALTLSVSLSADSLASGTGAGLVGTGALQTGIMAFVCGFIVMSAGQLLGRKMNIKSEKNFSWIGGAVLIVLAVSKLL